MAESVNLIKYIIEKVLNFFFSANVVRLENGDFISIGSIILVCLIFSTLFAAFLRVVPGVSLNTQSAYREPPASRSDRSLPGGQ